MIGMAMAMTETSSGREDYLSPLALAADRDGKNLYIAEATAGRIAVFDVAEGKAARRIALPSSPGGLVLSPDGSRLYVTGAAPDGEVFIVNTASAKITGKIAAGHTPTAPVLSPDGKSLSVSNRFDNDESVIDLAAGKEVASQKTDEFGHVRHGGIAQVLAGAGARGILLGMALGILTTGLRILFGADRPYGGNR
jgi:DNA-binding beta-propeller fold protein YncE